MPPTAAKPTVSIPISPEQARELAALCARYRVRRRGLFGSAATGRFDPTHSDFDFTVDFDPPEEMDLVKQYFGFQEEAATLLGRSVDLVERSAIRNPYFRQVLERDEVVDLWILKQSGYFSAGGTVCAPVPGRVVLRRLSCRLPTGQLLPPGFVIARSGARKQSQPVRYSLNPYRLPVRSGLESTGAVGIAALVVPPPSR